MATLPTAAQVQSATVTNAQQKTYFGDLLDFLLALLGSDSADKPAARAALGAAEVGRGIGKTQTVLSGPVDSDGYASFGGSVGTATLTATGTLRVAAAAGGDLSYVGNITNPAFTSPAGNGTGYLMLSVTADGVVTASVRSLIPAYQFGGTYSTASGQFTHNIQEGVSKVGNGSSAAQVYEVCIGECPHTAGVWSGTIVWYALKRQYYGEAAIPANGTAIVFSHKLGVPITPLAQFQWGFKCETADVGSGAAVGDFIPMGPMDNGVSTAMGAFHGRLSSSVNGAYGSISPANKSSGSRANVTSVANFKAALYVSAGW